MKSEICDCDVIHAEAVARARRHMPDEGRLRELADFFKAVGDSTRVRLLCALEPGEMCVCDLAALLGMSKSAVSHQLKALRLANLVRFRREGKIVFYTVADEHVRQIFETGLEHVGE